MVSLIGLHFESAEVPQSRGLLTLKPEPFLTFLLDQEIINHVREKQQQRRFYPVSHTP